MSDRWDELASYMRDYPTTLVSQEPVKELIAQVRRLERELKKFKRRCACCTEYDF